MFYRYRYETDIYPTLSRVPLHVRMKLDLTGLKISLKDWLAFSFEERTALCHLPADAEDEKQAFSSFLDFLSRKYTGATAARLPPVDDSPWTTLNRIPDSISEKTKGYSQAVSLDEWARWTNEQRYVLYKLSISKNDPEQFFEALKEFREDSRGTD